MATEKEYEEARDAMPAEYCGIGIRNGKANAILEIDGKKMDVPATLIVEVADYLRKYHPHIFEK